MLELPVVQRVCDVCDVESSSSLGVVEDDKVTFEHLLLKLREVVGDNDRADIFHYRNAEKKTDQPLVQIWMLSGEYPYNILFKNHFHQRTSF